MFDCKHPLSVSFNNTIRQLGEVLMSYGLQSLGGLTQIYLFMDPLCRYAPLISAVLIKKLRNITKDSGSRMIDS